MMMFTSSHGGGGIFQISGAAVRRSQEMCSFEYELISNEAAYAWGVSTSPGQWLIQKHLHKTPSHRRTSRSLSLSPLQSGSIQQPACGDACSASLPGLGVQGLSVPQITVPINSESNITEVMSQQRLYWRGRSFWDTFISFFLWGRKMENKGIKILMLVNKHSLEKKCEPSL